jgi:hypothetical protein
MRAAVLALLLAACRPPGEADVHPDLAAAAKVGRPTELHRVLERLIDEGRATDADRATAWAAADRKDDGTAAYAFAMAALAGRLAQARGLSALELVRETERWALRSIERDPDLDGGAARRLLGTLYVLAGPHTAKGDSEEGLDLLAALCEQHPEVAVNQLRLAEAYVSLGDPEGGRPALCAARAGRGRLSREEQQLLARLLEDAGGEGGLACGGS